MERDKGKHHLRGLPALDDMGLPKIEMSDVASIFIGAIDMAKERQMRQVISILDELRGKDGCVSVDVFKRVLGERVK